MADFRGQCAGKILFEREGLSRSFAESRESWKGFTRSLAHCSSSKVWDARGNGNGNIAPTITGDHNNRITDYTALCVITGADLYNQALTEEVSMTLCAGRNDCQKVPCVVFAKTDPSCGKALAMATQQGGAEIGKDLCPTLTAAAGTSGNNQPVFCYALYQSSFNQGMNAQFDIGIDDKGIAHTLVAKGPGAIAYGVPLGFRPENTRLYEEVSSTICNGTNPGHHQGVLILDRASIELRRATPTECGRLQGMPDWWCEDVPHSDSAEYKMWGNGMALPCVLYVMENVVSVLSLRLLDSLLEVSE